MRISDWSSDVCSSVLPTVAPAKAGAVGGLARPRQRPPPSRGRRDIRGIFMRKIGLIGGMSWASTEIYYRHLNKGVQKRIGTSCSAPILLESLNYCELSRLTTPEQWDHARDVRSESAKRLQDRSEEHWVGKEGGGT